MANKQNVSTGLAWALAGFATLSIGDAIAKTFVGQWPGGAAAALRYAFGALALTVAVAIAHGRAGFVFPQPGLQVLRGLGVAIATTCFFIAVQIMPLADATSIQFTSPMITALLSAIFLRERPPKQVYLATAMAFAGVLIVLRPEVSRLGVGVAYPLMSALGFAILMIGNRWSAGAAPALVMQWLVAMCATPILILGAGMAHVTGAPAFQIGVPTMGVALGCLAIAFSATFAHLMIYLATTHASAATVAPMTYVQLLVAIALGWSLFGEAPDLIALGGAVLIISGGVYLWWSQRTPNLGGAEE